MGGDYFHNRPLTNRGVAYEIGGGIVGSVL